MANNRIYLRCKACGEKFYLGKRYCDGYWWERYGDKDPLDRQLNDFYDRHIYCNGYGLDCFEISYEMEPEFEEPEDHGKTYGVT